MNRQRKAILKGMTDKILKNKYVWTATLAVAAAAVLAVLIVRACEAAEQSGIGITTDQQIDLTPQQIERIKDIGEWEFLAVVDEEMVDTVRRGLFSDDQLVRIYYGTVRLGINLHQVSPGWLTLDGDSLTARLPPIGLLAKDFIDEARTRSFHESGRWTAADREHLYRKAYRRMLAHAMTPDNLLQARQNGEQHFRSLMNALGIRRLRIEWEQAE